MGLTGEETRRNGARREISRQTVALLKDYIGRGPTTARTYVDGDLILVVLGDTLTKAEKVLVGDENVELVRDMRRAFMGTMREALAEVVEGETSRQVLTVFGDHSVTPDYAIVGCLLEPLPGDGDGASADGRSQEPRDQQRQISRGMSALYKEFIGRGATEARTYVDEDVISVLLSDTLTRGEQTLADQERPGGVRELRREFQEALKRRAVDLVEDATGRGVAAFLSDHSIEPDYALEVFVMEAVDHGPAAADGGGTGDGESVPG